MPTLTGSAMMSGSGVGTNARVSADVEALTSIGWPPAANDTRQYPAAVSFTLRAAVGRPAAGARSGAVATSYFADYYNRVHVVPNEFDLGTLSSEQNRTVEVWNARLTDNTLTSISTLNTDGISLTPTATPTTFKPTESRNYSLTVTLNGPPDVDARHTFNFAADAPRLRTLAVRMILWAFSPDWTNGITERMEWLTDVIASFDSSEQRGASRLAPRKRYEFEAFFTKADRRLAEVNLWGWGGLVWALPIWPDGQQLAAATTIGQTTIPVTTTNRDFYAGGYAAIIESPTSYEVIEIASLTSSSITLALATQKALPAGSMIYPVRFARLSDRVSLPRWDGQSSGARLAFDVVDTVDFTEATTGTTYRSYPVLTTKPDWSGGFDLEMHRKLAELDSLTGRRYIDDEAGVPITIQRMRFTFTSKAEIQAMRGLLYWMRGRARGVWIPTWEDDLEMVVPVTSGVTTTMIVKDVNYALMLGVDANRRDLRIQLTDGAILYRRVSSVTRNEDGTETLTLDSAFGRTIALADIVQISFLTLCRLDADAVEVAFWTGDVAQVALAFRGQKHGI